MWLDPDLITDISEHQREQIAAAMAANFGLLTGGPGTGKTWCIAKLVEAWRRHVGGTVSVAAPTGKAASRLNEVYPNLNARTIHSTLEPHVDDLGWHFTKTEHNPLNCSLLIGDEQSMTDSSLMSNLLGAVSVGTKVLLVGDPFQLPPVGRGKPFPDMIRAGLPHGHLTEIHRFAGRIARVCDQIKKGQRWAASPKVDLEATPPENFRHFEVGSAAATIATLKDVIGRMPARGWDPIDDVQVLCAVNEKSPLSRKNLNTHLQELLNPLGERVDKIPFRVGDKVICGRNQMKRDEEAEEPTYIANGDSGRVTEIDKTRVTVRVGKKVLYLKKTDLVDWDLFYAGTVHRGQGSQWPCVITIADDYPGANFVCDRSWHYTAYSRASKLSIVIGKRSTIDRHCTKVGMGERKTFLKERIQQWYQEPAHV